MNHNEYAVSRMKMPPVQEYASSLVRINRKCHENIKRVRFDINAWYYQGGYKINIYALSCLVHIPRGGSHIDMVYVYVPTYWGALSQILV